jgi:hypothetical protein
MGHPILVVALLLVLMIDALTLPGSWLEGGVSTVGRYLNRDLLGNRPSSRGTPWGRTVEGYFVLDQSGMKAVFPDDDSWGDTVQVLSERPGSVLHLLYRGVRTRYGLWAVTWQRTSEWIELSFGSDFSPAQAAEARRVFAQRVSGVDAARLTKADIVDLSPLPAGFAHNLISSAIAVLLLCSCRMLPVWWRARRARHAEERDLCPACGYSILGLRKKLCPECGSPIQYKDPGAGPGS